MHNTNIKNLDLNLLLGLQALLEEKHISRAALRIGLSQPAMSRIFARLKLMFNDALLVRTSSGLQLTSRAEDLYQPLMTILADINKILIPPVKDPLKMQAEIVIATRDNETVTILPKLMHYLTNAAPNLRFRIVSLIGDDLSPLENNQVDFIITGTDSKSATLCRNTLYKENFVCLVASDNPLIRGRFTLEKFIKLKHCLVTITGHGPGLVDKILEEKGLKRQVVIMLPHFLTVPFIIAKTNFVVTLPRKIGELFVTHENITVLEPPMTLPSFPIYLYWHSRNQNNPVNVWLRKVIREQFRG